MPHHGDDSGAFEAMKRDVLKRIEGAQQLQQDIQQILGPTGQFPEGKLGDDDEGEIRIAIGNQNGKVVISFGGPVAWIGFTAAQAREIAETLIKHAEYVEHGK